MELKKITFNDNQAAAVNTYVGIMLNACRVVTSHLSQSGMNGNYFHDFETLANDDTVDKTWLANDLADLVTRCNGAYLRAEFANIGFSSINLIWFERMHNQAVNLASEMTTFDGVDLTK